MDILSVGEVSRQLRVSESKVFRLSRRSEDPLPLRILRGRQRGAFVFRSELIAWAKRNSCPYEERHLFYGDKADLTVHV